MPKAAAHTFLKPFIEPWELVAVTPLHASTAAEAGWSVSVCLCLALKMSFCLGLDCTLRGGNSLFPG